MSATKANFVHRMRKKLEDSLVHLMFYCGVVHDATSRRTTAHIHCGSSGFGAAAPLLDVSFSDDPFGFAVTRRDDGSVIFNSTAPDVAQPFPNLIYSDQFLSLSTSLSLSAKVYGLGEQVRLQSPSTFADDV